MQETADGRVVGWLATCVFKPCLAYTGAVILLLRAGWYRWYSPGRAQPEAALPLFATGLCAITLAPVRWQ